ncbi:hypothetical protein TRVL_04273 [Trypanosoma vivax]|nr:hypothetical protein TRVL_04273 [Trypanosoma vivax]
MKMEKRHEPEIDSEGYAMYLHTILIGFSVPVGHRCVIPESPGTLPLTAGSTHMVLRRVPGEFFFFSPSLFSARRFVWVPRQGVACSYTALTKCIHASKWRYMPIDCEEEGA